MGEEKEEIKFVEFLDLDNMIRAMVSSRAPLLLHIELDKRHIYFQSQPSFKETIYYFVELPKISGKYVIFDIMSGKISFSDHLKMDPNFRTIPIVDVSRQNIFPKEILETK
jgi:hypothetical protein